MANDSANGRNDRVQGPPGDLRDISRVGLGARGTNRWWGVWEGAGAGEDRSRGVDVDGPRGGECGCDAADKEPECAEGANVIDSTRPLTGAWNSMEVRSWIAVMVAKAVDSVADAAEARETRQRS